MKSKDYEYKQLDIEYEINAQRKQELISEIKIFINRGYIVHSKILQIGKNNVEYNFLYEWLKNNNINIKGINGTISGEVSNYIHTPKMGQSFIPELLEDEEQKNLFFEFRYSLISKMKYLLEGCLLIKWTGWFCFN